ncbi:MAG: FlgD immunoglobulin-like domain containing protein [Bacteroidota bacterium]
MTIKFMLLSLTCILPFLAPAQTLLSAPQKIVIDAPRNRLLVSNEGTGDIVEIDSVGIQHPFVPGAGFIDGMEIVGDTVYGVCNGRKIKAYNLVTKNLVMNITIPGTTTKYLSSIISDSAGHLFISCPKLNEIYRLNISDQSWWVFAKDNGLNNPNGMLLEKENNRIIVIGDSPSPSSIWAISLTDSTVSTIITTSLNSPDGIVRDKFGYYYTGGYYLPAIYMTDPNFSQPPEAFFPGTSMVYPTYDERDHSLLITHYNSNTWERIPLTTTGISSGKYTDDFTMHPVFPNPFNCSVTIRFELNRYCKTHMEVFNASGKLIAKPVYKENDPGSYFISWDGKNATGDAVEEGMYYFRMTVNGVIQTQKGLMTKHQ